MGPSDKFQGLRGRGGDLLGLGLLAPPSVVSASGSGASAIDPMTLSPMGAWDVNRSTLFGNSNGTGATAVGSGFNWIADRSGNSRQLTGDGTRPGPVLRTDATLSKNYAEYSFSAGGRLITPSFTAAAPVTVFLVARARTFNNDAYLVSSRAGFSTIITQRTPTPNVIFYDGTADAGTQTMSLTAWHVITAVFNGASSTLQIDNNTAVTGNPGSTGINGGLALGAGPDGAPDHWGDYDIMSMYAFGSALSGSNISGVKTYLGNDARLSL